MYVCRAKKSVSINLYDNFMKKTFSAIVSFLRLPVIVYKESDFVSDVARLVLSETWESVQGDKHWITVENKRYSVKFWVGNKLYGYFSDGMIRNKTAEAEARWCSEMPARELLFEIEKKFRRASALFELQEEIEAGIARKNVFSRLIK